jgi:hypothetical protein
MMRRRWKLVVGLLLVCLVVFVYGRKIFFLQAKKLIKQNLEKALPCRLSIEKMRAGLFYGIVLEDLEIRFPQALGIAVNIQVKEACVDYNLWQNLFSKQKPVRKLRLVSPDIGIFYPQKPMERQIAVARETKEKLNLGEFELILEKGQLSFGQAQGLLKDLQGRLSVRQDGLFLHDLKVTFKDNPRDTLKICGELSPEHLSMTANLEHLKFGDFDLLTNCVLTLDRELKLQDESSRISGSFKTYGSVLTERPLPELNSSFEISDSKLRIFSCSLGDNYDLRGVVSLNSPLNADLSLNFYQAAPNELVPQFCPGAEKPDFSGLVNGLIKITGELARPKIDGYLEAVQGHLGELDFVSADINIRGRYPKISIVDSRICREQDSFILEGEIDLGNGKLEGREPVEVEVKADKAMFWQGWDITSPGDNQVHMSKNLANDFKVTFDSFVGNEDIASSSGNNYTNELGLECKVLGNKVLRLRLKEEEEILGVERRVRF